MAHARPSNIPPVHVPARIATQLRASQVAFVIGDLALLAVVGCAGALIHATLTGPADQQLIDRLPLWLLLAAGIAFVVALTGTIASRAIRRSARRDLAAWSPTRREAPTAADIAGSVQR